MRLIGIPDQRCRRRAFDASWELTKGSWTLTLSCGLTRLKARLFPFVLDSPQQARQRPDVVRKDLLRPRLSIMKVCLCGARAAQDVGRVQPRFSLAP